MGKHVDISPKKYKATLTVYVVEVLQWLVYKGTGFVNSRV
jgi:hypothetical protein